nr:restriction endonuclease [Desulfobacula sp.]
MGWKELQNATAELFKSVGCTTEVEIDVEGARGKHNIDVYVQFKMLSFKCVWVIECKNWGSNIPKEKVLALQSIVQDVGADKGVLVSKKGFQSGAIRCAQHSNIILTDFDDLRAYIYAEINNHGWDDLSRRVKYISSQLFEKKGENPNYQDIGNVSNIDLKIMNARYGDGRLVLIRSLNEKAGDEIFIKHSKPEEFLKHANNLLDEIQKRNNIA